MPKITGNTLAEHRERTRRALFDSLGQLLAAKPFDKITLSDVATNAHVGRTAVYNHFADKEDLLLAYIENETRSYVARLSQALEDVQDPLDRLRVYIREQALLKQHYHFPSGARLTDTLSRDTVGRLHSHADIMEHMLSQILHEAIDQGQLPNQDVAMSVQLIHACVLGGRPTPTNPMQRERYLHSLDSFVLQAVGAQQAAHPVPVSLDHDDDAPAPSVSRCPMAG